MNNLKILPKMCRFFLSVFSVILILGLCLLLYTDFIFQISNNSQFQHYNLGWYISNTKQLRIEVLQIWLIYFKYHTTQHCIITILVDIFQISNNSGIEALQSWLIYFKYQTTQNWGITNLVDIFQISYNSALHHYNLGWYISNIKQLRNWGITILVDTFQISNNSELQHYHLGSYISNIKQLRIAALQSWLIYFKYQTTQNCRITILVDIFQISNKSELQHYNLGWYISNIKELRIAAWQCW